MCLVGDEVGVEFGVWGWAGWVGQAGRHGARLHTSFRKPLIDDAAIICLQYKHYYIYVLQFGTSS